MRYAPLFLVPALLAVGLGYLWAYSPLLFAFAGLVIVAVLGVVGYLVWTAMIMDDSSHTSESPAPYAVTKQPQP